MDVSVERILVNEDFKYSVSGRRRVACARAGVCGRAARWRHAGIRRRFAGAALSAFALLALLGGVRPAEGGADPKSAQAATACDEDLPYEFVAGVYSLIGKPPAGGADGAPYSGALRLSVGPGCVLNLVRCIGRTRVTGIARFELATAEQIPVLRTTFEADGTVYEGRYKIDGDFNNYAILTGPYRVRGDDRTLPGWEFAYVDPWRRPDCS